MTDVKSKNNQSESEDKKCWLREEVLDLIADYKSRPEMWDVKHRLYRDKRIKKRFLKHLSIKYSTSEIEINRKFHNLRTQFHQQLRRTESKSRREASDDVKSPWEYFDAMKFIIDSRCNEKTVVEKDNSESSVRKKEVNNKKPVKRKLNSELLNKSVIIHDVVISTADPEIADPLVNTQFTPKIAKLETDESTVKVTQTKNIVSSTANIEPQSQIWNVTYSPGEAESISKVWAIEYAKLPEDQQLFAKKAIDDILFQGRLGTLDKSSININKTVRVMPSPSEESSCSSYQLDDSLSPNPDSSIVFIKEEGYDPYAESSDVDVLQ